MARRSGSGTSGSSEGARAGSLRLPARLSYFTLLAVEHDATNNLGAQAAKLLKLSDLKRCTYRNHFHAAPAAAPVVPRYVAADRTGAAVRGGGVPGDPLTTEREHHVKIQFPYRINHQGGFKKATPDQLVNLGFAAIGAIPEIGSVFKTVFRPLWRERHLAKTAVNGGVQAIEAMLGMRKGGALQWIRKELLGKWAARTQQAIAQANAALDACIAMTEFLATAGGWKSWLIPAGIQALAAELLPGLRGMRSDMNAALQTASEEIRLFLADLLGEQAAAVVMAAGSQAAAASALPGSRSKARNAHNAADPHTRGKDLPREKRKKTQDQDTTNTAKGAGRSHNALQRTRQVFGKMAHVATGLVGEHMVDYSELKRLGGSFPHDKDQRFPAGAAVAKLNADKRPVNLSIEDLPKVPHKGIDAVWAHNGSYTVTEAKARGSVFVLEGMAAKRAPKELKSLEDKVLFLLLSTSATEEGDGKRLVQMSRGWVRQRAFKESLSEEAEAALESDLCDRRVVLVTFESDGAVDHAQALSELELGVPNEEALAHPAHGVQRTWTKQSINRIALFKGARTDSGRRTRRPRPNQSRRSGRVNTG